MTSAPSSGLKQYWLSEALKAGFVAELYVLWVPRMVAYDRMKARNGKSVSKTQRHDLEQDVERWYKLYSRHYKEKRIENE